MILHWNCPKWPSYISRELRCSGFALSSAAALKKIITVCENCTYSSGSVCVCVCLLCDGMLVPVVRLYWWRHLLLSSTSFRCRMLYGRRSGPVPSAVMPLGSSRRAVVARSLQKLRLPAWELRWIWSSGRRRIYSYFWLWFCPLLLSWQIWTVSIKKKSVSRHLCWLMFLWPFAVTVHSVGG